MWVCKEDACSQRHTPNRLVMIQIYLPLDLCDCQRSARDRTANFNSSKSFGVVDTFASISMKAFLAMRAKDAFTLNVVTSTECSRIWLNFLDLFSNSNKRWTELDRSNHLKKSASLTYLRGIVAKAVSSLGSYGLVALC